MRMPMETENVTYHPDGHQPMPLIRARLAPLETPSRLVR